MSVVTYLLGEHGVLYALLDRVEELARGAEEELAPPHLEELGRLQRRSLMGMGSHV